VKRNRTGPPLRVIQGGKRKLNTAPLSYEERKAIQRAIQIRYLRTHKTNKRLLDYWRTRCKDEKRPFVHLSLDPISPRLEIDLSKTETCFTNHTVIILKLVCLLTDCMRRVCTPKSFLVSQLPIEREDF